MTRKRYKHSAYWYAYHYGWTHSEETSLSMQYLDIHSYRPRMRERGDGQFRGEDWFAWRSAPRQLDSTFNPLVLVVCIAVDIGLAMRNEVRRLADPVERDCMKRELVRDLRKIRRPFYYARETARRRALASERRRIRRRRTTAPMPTREELLSAWEDRRASRAAMVRLGGMLHDLECHVDNCLRFDLDGHVVGRNGGIRGWIAENVPELAPKYKTLMRYKALAVRLRQATDTKDPTPTSSLLREPRGELVAGVIDDQDAVFSHFFSELERMLSPAAVFLDAPRKDLFRKRRRQ